MNMKVLKIQILFPLLLLAMLSCQLEEVPPPNIILVSMDDLGWSDLGCYGSEVRTPHIDALAEGGMRFTQFHNTSKCFPSRACLLTGIYAQQNGYATSFNGPLIHAVTLGEVLREAGYLTLWSGKHHGLENPIYRGFDRYYGLKDGACNHFNPGNQRPGEGAPARKGPAGNKRQRAWCIDSLMFTPYTPAVKDFYTTDYFTSAALEWLEEYQDDARPLFLYLSYTAPHDPLMAWPEDIAKYEGMYEKGFEGIRKARYEKQLQMGLIDERYKLSEATHADWEDLSEEERRDEIRKMQVYAAMIDRVDQNMGLLLEKLKATGRYENTLIMLVSDNGASAEVVHLEDDYGEIGSLTRWASLGPDWANVGNTPFRYFKNYSFEGGINTPLIVHWPGQVEAGSFSEFPGHFIDLMPTILEVGRASYPEVFGGQDIIPMQGLSLVPAFRGEVEERDKPLFWEWGKGQAVRRGGWKLVRHGLDREWELYHVQEDPCETRNLAAAEAERAAALEALFQNWKLSLPD